MAGALRDTQTFDGTAWHPLPPWAQFPAKLGAWLADEPRDGSRTVVALALPTRAYAAVLAAAGYVLAAGGRNTADPGRRARHFAALCTLPLDAPVRVERGGRQLAGRFGGCEVRAGMRWLRVQVQERALGGTAHLIPEADAFAVTAAPGEVLVTLPRRQQGRPLAPRRTLLRALLDDRALRAFVRETQRACVVVGRCSVLRTEAAALELGATDAAGRVHDGRLTDVLRTRDARADARPHRTELVSAADGPRDGSSNGRKAELAGRGASAASDDGPDVVVFDGAAGFLRWRHHWPAAHWLVLLDHTEPRTRDAAAALNDAYAVRGGADACVPVDLSPPPGVTGMSFREAVR